MSCRVDTTERFNQEFRKLDHYTQRMLKAWIEKHLVGCEDPRAKGKGLTANLAGYSFPLKYFMTFCANWVWMKRMMRSPGRRTVVPFGISASPART